MNDIQPNDILEYIGELFFQLLQTNLRQKALDLNVKRKLLKFLSKTNEFLGDQIFFLEYIGELF